MSALLVAGNAFFLKQRFITKFANSIIFFSVIFAVSSEPVKTPPWSFAANISNEEIDAFMEKKQKEKGERPPKKRRHIFASSDEDLSDCESPKSTSVLNVKYVFKICPLSQMYDLFMGDPITFAQMT